VRPRRRPLTGVDYLGSLDAAWLRELAARLEDNLWQKASTTDMTLTIRIYDR